MAFHSNRRQTTTIPARGIPRRYAWIVFALTSAC